jgi:ArsR family transcriptional regulator
VNDDQFRRIAKTLADPARLAALEKISDNGEASCSVLRDCLNLTAATISHHVSELIDSGLVDQRRDGKFLILSLNQKVWKAYLQELQRRIPAR